VVVGTLTSVGEKSKRQVKAKQWGEGHAGKEATEFTVKKRLKIHDKIVRTGAGGANSSMRGQPHGITKKKRIWKAGVR